MTRKIIGTTALIACIAVVVFYAHAYAQGRPVTVTKVDYEKTRVPADGSASSVIERGTIQIAADGRYRIDRTADNGDRTAEIVDVAKNQRAVVNFTMNTVTTGSLRTPWVAPTGRPGQVPGGAPSPFQKDGETRISLGTKTVGSLVLDGTRIITTFSHGDHQIEHAAEIWATHSAARGVVPVIVELRLESPNEVLDQHLLGASTTQVAGTVFDVPAGLTAVAPVH